MSVLWEIPQDNGDQLLLRKQLVKKIHLLIDLAEMWTAADESRATAEEESEDQDMAD